MIIGLGTDIVEIVRIQDALQRHGISFAERILADVEMQEFLARGGLQKERAVSYLAKRFAAKEAFAKAWGTGISAEVNLHDVQTLNDPRGKPYLHYSPALQNIMQERCWIAHVTLADEKQYAVATVLIAAQGSTNLHK